MNRAFTPFCVAVVLLAGCGLIVESAWLIAHVREQRRDDRAESPAPSQPAGSGPLASVTTPPGTQADRVGLDYVLADSEGDRATIAVTWSADGGTTWAPATEAAAAGSDGVTGLAAAPSGTAHRFVWDSYADCGPSDLLARLRVTPADGVTGVAGLPATTGDFWLRDRMVQTLAGGAGGGTFNFPGHVLVDGAGHLIVVDTLNHRVWVRNTQAVAVAAYGQTIAAGAAVAVAGTGLAGWNGDHQLATAAQLNFPRAGAVDAADHLFLADSLNQRIRRVDRTTGYITTVCGSGAVGSTGNGGVATGAAMNDPRGVVVDGSGNLYVADSENHWVRFVNRTSAPVTLFNVTVAASAVERVIGTGGSGDSGDGGQPRLCDLDKPWGLARDGNGVVYVADYDKHTVRAANPGPNAVTIGNVTVGADRIDVVAGQKGKAGSTGDGGSAAQAYVNRPTGVALDGAGNLFITDFNNHRVRAVNAGGSTITLAGVTIASGAIDTVAGGGASPGPNDGDGGAATAARLAGPEGLAVLASSGVALLADTGLSRVRAVNLGASAVTVAGVPIAAGEIDTVAGVVVSALPLIVPEGLAATAAAAYVADAGGHRLVRLDLATRALAVVAGTGTAGYSGDGGAASTATLDGPLAVALVGTGGCVVADTQNGVVRCVNVGGTTLTVAGVAVAPSDLDTIPFGGTFASPRGVAADGGGHVFVADAGDHTIRRIDAGTGAIAVVAGISGLAGFSGDGAAATLAQLRAPEGIAVDGSGNLVIADTGNHAVRVVNRGGATITVCGVTIGPGTIATIAGTPATGGYNGDGMAATSARLLAPRAAILVPGGGHCFVADRGNHRVRRVHGSNGLIATVLGTGTPGYNGDGIPSVNAHVNAPGGLARDAMGGVLVADSQNRRVRRFGP